MMPTRARDLRHLTDWEAITSAEVESNKRMWQAPSGRAAYRTVQVSSEHALSILGCCCDDMRRENARSVIFKPADGVIVVRCRDCVYITIPIDVTSRDNACAIGSIGDVLLHRPLTIAEVPVPRTKARQLVRYVSQCQSRGFAWESVQRRPLLAPVPRHGVVGR